MILTPRCTVNICSRRIIMTTSRAGSNHFPVFFFRLAAGILMQMKAMNSRSQTLK